MRRSAARLRNVKPPESAHTSTTRLFHRLHLNITRHPHVLANNTLTPRRLPSTARQGRKSGTSQPPRH